MKKFLLTTAAFGMLAVPAMAAELPTLYYRAPPPPIPVLGWTGFYVGGTLGGIWLDSNITPTYSTSCNPAALAQACAGAAAFAAVLPSNVGDSPAGFIGGGEIGYNWQLGRFVYGLETDFSGTSVSSSTSFANSGVISGFPANVISATGGASEKVDYLGTVRARTGFVVIPPLLVYATGGLAYGNVSANASLEEQVRGPCATCGPAPSVAASVSSTRIGWTVGGGWEWMFVPNWTVKGEYLYYDLGSSTFASPALVQTNTAGVVAVVANGGTTIDYKGSIARIGVNYKFW
jgi:outer membrane immunogenic protein